MTFVVGVVLFAIGICLSIALHEWGHLMVAKRSGMLVRRYFVGFGPTIWSFHRGETEYGLKAIPLGGFCDIAGMTTLDELPPGQEHRAMYRKSGRARVATLLGGPAMNIVLGLVLVYVLALGWGIPNIHPDLTPRIAGTGCVAATQAAPSGSDAGALAPCSGPGPADAAGIRPGDVVRSVDGTAVATNADLIAVTRSASGTVDVRIERDGREMTVPVAVTRAQRWERTVDGGYRSTEVGVMGVSLRQPQMYIEKDALSAVPATFVFIGDLMVETGKALASLPGKIPGVVAAIFGGERAADGPVSVVGASVVGGEAVERGVWDLFLILLISINFFLGAFNLVPVPPLDGGHIAVVGFEKVRDRLRRLRGREAGAPVDYRKLAPLTMTMWVLLMGLGLLVITADIVNPIAVFR